jgi:para-nitrobenzyl esterase
MNYKLVLFITLFTQMAEYSFAQNNIENTAATLVKTENGTLDGMIEKSGVRSFKGIPFAAPPVGDLRWKEPQRAKDWQGIREAKQFAAKGMQYNIFGDMNFRSAGTSEDCLYLNVWEPPGKNKALPVLVYFYGGGFVAGDGSEPRYDGESMATKGIVTVTVNYRLGVFGFMSHPELSKESPTHSSGNYGLLDQVAALHWVRKNIAAFGGDPKRVTIAGESAGSIAVSALMASPLSKNLIAGAIGESGSVLGALSAVPLDKGEQAGVDFASSIGLHSLAELRNLNADSLLAASKNFGVFRFSVTVDGYFFPKSPYTIYEAGKQAHVPLLAGWNSEESNYHSITGNEKPTKENFIKAVQKLYGDSASEALKNYNPSTDEEAEQVATDLASDRFISYSTWKWIDLQSKTGEKPVYRYLFSRPRPTSTGAVHSAEIEYAMGNLATNKVYAWTDDDYKVSKIMQEYFANFIKSANPNGDGLPTWPIVNKAINVQVMHIDVNTRVELDRHRNRYLFLDRYAKK